MAEPTRSTSVGRRPLLAGRDREWSLLRAALAAALAGHGSLTLISGEAGIGKTVLAEALGAEAEAHGARVLVGRCYDLSETPPYGPWTENLARVPPIADAPTPPDLTGSGAGSQAALFTQVRAYLATLAAHQPLVLLLDDLHWADPASLDLLRVLARDLAALPLLLLATYRDELTYSHPLYALLPVLVHEAPTTRLDLHRLGLADLADLVRPRYALPAEEEHRLVGYLHEHAEGNPFFASELLHTLEEEAVLHHDGAGWQLGDLAAVVVPPLLRQVVDARAARLGEAARDLLMVAAVIGQVVPLDLWAAVAEPDEEALLPLVERAAAARLLVETDDGAGVSFVHALVREALYAGLPPSRRRSLHRRVAEACAA